MATLPNIPPISLGQVITNYGGSANNLRSYLSGGAFVDSGIANGTNVNIPNTGTISLSSFYGAFTPQVLVFSSAGTSGNIVVQRGASNATAGITAAGGGGGAANTISLQPGGGGGGGGWATVKFPVGNANNNMTNLSCTVGTGGVRGINSDGGDGGASTFDLFTSPFLPPQNIILCLGGKGGHIGGLTSGGNGGNGGTSNGSPNISGSNGTNGNVSGGIGGNSAQGLTGSTLIQSGGNGSNTAAGANGSDGFIIIKFT